MEINENQLTIIIGLLIISLLSGYISVRQSSEYEPDKSIFCGIKSLPQGYGRYGNRYECLRRGFGSGMNRNENKYPFRKWGYVFVAIVIAILVYNYYIKYQKKKQNEMKNK